MRIALVEDDSDQAALLEVWFVDEGFECYVFENGAKALKAFQKESFDLILLDWYLPDINGDKILAWIREHIDWQIPVIFVTQRDAEEDIAYALEKGADDYVPKPIKPLVLKARVHALLRRVHGPEKSINRTLDFGAYHFDQESHQLSFGGEPVQLTQKEFELALFLFKNAGRLLSRAHLLESVWGHSAELNTRTLDTHISRLRKKLKLGSVEAGWRLSAVYHHGYRLESVSE